MARKKPHAERPDGIGPDHIEPHRGLARHASPVSIILLGALVAFGLSGLAGSRSSTSTIATAAVDVTVRTPAIVRNGEMLETMIDIRARRPIRKLVVGIEEGLWEGITINSMVPAAAQEAFEDGLFRFAFAALEAGQPFLFKIDQQVNPGLGGKRQGRVVIFDDQERLAELPLELRVLP